LKGCATCAVVIVTSKTGVVMVETGLICPNFQNIHPIKKISRNLTYCRFTLLTKKPPKNKHCILTKSLFEAMPSHIGQEMKSRKKTKTDSLKYYFEFGVLVPQQREDFFRGHSIIMAV
jgi:hypothetical protein